jgi:glycosyltransferase involved in cell wall biosynthesis
LALARHWLFKRRSTAVRVLLLSAYDAQSHRSWHQCLTQGLADWQWTVLTLPPRHFSWRVRGNPLQWAVTERELLEAPYDLLLATSMVDLATLCGLIPSLASTPALLYFHENQFAYPEGASPHGLLEPQMVSVYSAMRAQQLLFNSDFNRCSFLKGCASLLAGFPDRVPAGIVEQFVEKSRVVPVPVEIAVPANTAVRDRNLPLQLLWNHRWEYDKGPAELLALAVALVASGTPFVLHVVGQQFRRQPPEFEAIKSTLESAGALGQWGYLNKRSDYLALLARCDVVLSTALHDFQGLSVIEACAAGCTPVLPARLVYPEYFDDQFLYADIEGALDKLAELAERKQSGTELPGVTVSEFSPEQLLPVYRELLYGQRAGN